jgi:hypothetical protein
MNLYQDVNCNGAAIPVTQPPPNTCAVLPNSSQYGRARAPAPSVTASNCNASGGVPTIPPPQATAAARICAASTLSGGCALGQVCVPSMIDAPFLAKVCVWKSGAASCPAGFSEQHVYASSLDDSRGCTACSCGNPMASCTVTTTLWTHPLLDCYGYSAQVSNNNSCVNLVNGSPRTVKLTKTTNGSCSPTGGQPTGSVALGADMITVCCMP